MPTPTVQRRWGTIPEAASLYGVSRDTIRRLIANGDIYAERITARLIRVDLDSMKGSPLGPTQRTVRRPVEVNERIARGDDL